jgi:ketosteroid isomerase-like protein
MSDLPAIADRVEIEALCGEFTDAAMMRDYDRFASLFTPDGAWRIPYANVDLVSREEIRAGIERAQRLIWEYFVQNTHLGTIQLDGNTAVGRAYVQEFGQMRDGSSRLHYSLYHDRYQRTADGWKFTERVYEIKYLDTTPLEGSAPDPAGDAGRPPTRRPRASKTVITAHHFARRLGIAIRCTRAGRVPGVPQDLLAIISTGRSTA